MILETVYRDSININNVISVIQVTQIFCIPIQSSNSSRTTRDLLADIEKKPPLRTLYGRCIAQVYKESTYFQIRCILQEVFTVLVQQRCQFFSANERWHKNRSDFTIFGHSFNLLLTQLSPIIPAFVTRSNKELFVLY